MSRTVVSADHHKDHAGRDIVTLWIREPGNRNPVVVMLWPEEAAQLARAIDIELQDIAHKERA